ncbi:MAG: arylsulfatase A-like enzyme, partial [Pseudohongiellaceae bacterium]
MLALAVACGPSETGDGPDPNPAEEARRPNVVLIIIDTLRADVLSSYGHSADPSPALSRLTADGVQFDSVISQTSWTLPSIGSMLTSQYPRTLGLYAEFDHALPERFVALAEVLNDHGYATFGATANPNINSRAQFDQGFDEYVDSIYVFRRSRDDVE